jgi:hypothetical protein
MVAAGGPRFLLIALHRERADSISSRWWQRHSWRSLPPTNVSQLADKLNALAQLRDMHGFKAPTKVAPTNAEGDGPARLIVMWGSGETLPVSHDTEPALANEAPSDD